MPKLSHTKLCFRDPNKTHILLIQQKLKRTHFIPRCIGQLLFCYKKKGHINLRVLCSIHSPARHTQVMLIAFYSFHKYNFTSYNIFLVFLHYVFYFTTHKTFITTYTQHHLYIYIKYNSYKVGT